MKNHRTNGKGVKEQGAFCQVPVTGGVIIVRQEVEEYQALGLLRIERQYVQEPDKVSLSLLSSLSLSLLILLSFFLPCLSLPAGSLAVVMDGGVVHSLKQILLHTPFAPHRPGLRAMGNGALTLTEEHQRDKREE